MDANNKSLGTVGANLVATVFPMSQQVVSADYSICDLQTIKQNAEFKTILRAKYASLLNAGIHLLISGLCDGSNKLLPFSAQHKSDLNDAVDKLSTEAQRIGVLRWITDGLDCGYIEDSSNYYRQCLSMFDSLITKLAAFQKQLDSYDEVSFVPTNSFHLSDFVSALAQHQSIRQQLVTIQGNARDIEANLYSLGNQFSLFLSEKSLSADPATIDDYKTRFALLFKHIPATFDCRAFNKAQVQKIKPVLLALKVNGSTAQNAKLIHTKTMNLYLSNYRTFFSWLRKNVDGVEQNPFLEVSVKGNKLQDVRRRAFTQKEISKILNYKPSHAGEAPSFRDDLRWFIPLALYTGMRLNEIAAIKVDDIKVIDDVWCVDLLSHDVKNISSRRTVPIAQYLIDTGFLEYVKSVRQQGHSILFYQIRVGKASPGKTGWGEPISRWFNRTVLKKTGIDADAELLKKQSVVFHCLRHTFINTCIKAGVQKHLVKRYVGHAQDDEVTIDVYSDVADISLSLLKDMVDEHAKWHLDM
jgi:integrase